MHSTILFSVYCIKSQMYQSVCLWNHISSFSRHLVQRRTRAVFQALLFLSSLLVSSGLASSPLVSPPLSSSLLASSLFASFPLVSFFLSSPLLFLSCSRVSRVCAFFICCPTLLRTSQANHANGPSVLPGMKPYWSWAVPQLNWLYFPNRTVAAERTFRHADLHPHWHLRTGVKRCFTTPHQPNGSGSAKTLWMYTYCLSTCLCKFFWQSMITLGYICIKISQSLSGDLLLFFALCIFPYLPCVFLNALLSVRWWGMSTAYVLLLLLSWVVNCLLYAEYRIDF